MKTETAPRNENRDPITGEPGSHPVGTGVGSLAGAATGAVVGSPGGPIGMAIGGVIGAIAGASAGHGLAEELEPTDKDASWENTYHLQPYYLPGYDFTDYSPAYMMGYEGPSIYQGLTFEQAERELASKWEDRRGMSRLQWEHARHAVRDGWHRGECATPGTTDRTAR